MELKDGWLVRQLDRVARDVEQWPEWMKREAEFSVSSSERNDSNEGAEPAITAKAGAGDQA